MTDSSKLRAASHVRMLVCAAILCALGAEASAQAPAPEAVEPAAPETVAPAESAPGAQAPEPPTAAESAAQANESGTPPAPQPPADVPQAGEEMPWWGEHAVAFQEEAWVPGEGLEFTSGDEMFSMALRLRAQFLYQVELPYDRANSERADAEQGLSIRRARIVFGGNMWGKKTQYKVELAVAPSDLGMTHLPGSENPPITNRDNYVSRSLLLDWYMQFNQLRDLNLRVGQYKIAYSRDRVVSSGNLQFVDRTALNQEFNLDRDIGVDFRSKDLFGLNKRLRYYLGVSNGDGHSAYETSDFGLMYLGRVEFLPFGNFDDYSQSDLERISKPGLSLGVAYARLENAAGNLGILGKRPADGGTTDFNNLTADATFKYRGLSVEGAYFYRDGKRDVGDATDDSGAKIAEEAPRDGWGAGLQAGYLLPTTDLEFAGRYSAIRAASSNTALKDSDEAGAAVSYYLARHAYKVQADWTRVWGEGVKNGGDDFGDGEDRLRVQMQAAF